MGRAPKIGKRVSNLTLAAARLTGSDGQIELIQMWPFKKKPKPTPAFAPPQQISFTGLDLGDRRHAACVLAADGEILAEEAVINTRECLEAFSQRFPGAVVAMETGTHSPWISRLFQARE